MSGPTSNPDGNRSGSPAYGTFARPRFSSHLSHESNDSAAVHSNDGDVSPKRRPSPERKPSRHVEFRKYLKRPHLTETQRTLSDALRSAKSREEQETLLPDEDYAGSDGCFNGRGEPMASRTVFTPDPHTVSRVYFNIHRYVCISIRFLGRIELTWSQHTTTPPGRDRRSIYNRSTAGTSHERAYCQAAG